MRFAKAQRSFLLEAFASFLFISLIIIASDSNPINSKSITAIDKPPNVVSNLKAEDVNSVAESHNLKGVREQSSNKEFVAVKSRSSALSKFNIFAASLLFGLSLSFGIQVNPIYSFAQWLVDPKIMGIGTILSWLSSMFAENLGGVLSAFISLKCFGRSFHFNYKSPSTAFISEFVGTFFLVFVILHFRAFFKYNKTLFHHVMEILVTTWISFAFISASRGSLNPILASSSFYIKAYSKISASESLSAALVDLDKEWFKIAPYYIGPYIGSLLASLVYRTMYDVSDEATKPLLPKGIFQSAGFNPLLEDIM